MFTELSVKNFKNFKNLELDNISLVNTISGFNQSGKTTFLESIFCLSGFYQPELMYSRIFNFRNIALTKAEELKYLFYGSNETNSPILLKAKYKNQKRSLKIDLDIEEKIKGLNIEYTIDNKSIKSQVKYQGAKPELDANGNIIMRNPFYHQINLSQEDHEQNIPTKIMSDSLSSNPDLLNNIARVNQIGKKELLINFLNDIFEEKIEDIYQNGNIIEVRKNNINSNVGIPINLLGDGFNKATFLFCNLFMDQKIILIDEIENGLHHTLYKKIILMMLKYVHEHQIQIFITTHSKEVLENLAEALKKNKDYQKNFSHYTLSISNNKNYAYRHNYEELEGTLKSTFDLRDE